MTEELQKLLCTLEIVKINVKGQPLDTERREIPLVAFAVRSNIRCFERGKRYGRGIDCTGWGCPLSCALTVSAAFDVRGAVKRCGLAEYGSGHGP